jgi:hypothetical protein
VKHSNGSDRNQPNGEAEMANQYPTFTDEEIQSEEWRDIPEWEGFYQASSLGRIRNVRTGKILSPGRAPNGYLIAILMRGDRVRYSRSVHRLVIKAFIGLDTRQVNHIDGVKHNNRITNLEYCTPKENKAHARALGLTPTGQRAGMNTHPECRMYGDDNPSRRLPERLLRGEKHGNATLTDKDVAEIKASLASGATGASLAKRYRVGKSTISRIKHGKERFTAKSLLN